MHRRYFNKLAMGSVCGGFLPHDSVVADETSRAAEPARASVNSDRIRGLLLGGLIGDALGGPVEFSSAGPDKTGLVGARDWDDDRKVTPKDLDELADSVPLLGYEELRPDTAPYGPWRANAVAGTLTDDSRHKIVLLNALSAAHQAEERLMARHVARAFLEFEPSMTDRDRKDLEALNEEGFREYRYASRWLLGERDLKNAKPLERLWAGINNCSGQMLLPPLAAAHAGNPEAAYRMAFDVDFIDAPLARDIAAALVASLAAVLGQRFESRSVRERYAALFSTMRATDPFGYAQVPFAGRPLHKWLDLVDELVRRADGSPKALYRLLENDGRPVYWWDAHFTLLVPLCMLKFCDFNPLAAMHLTLDFGHDTDSYAQVLGCVVGAVHGSRVFPATMRNAVERTLKTDYGQEVDRWMELLHSLR